MTKRFFIKQTSLEEELNAGPKAKRDTYTILQKRGYEPIIYISNSKYRLSRYYQGFSLITRILRLKKSIVLVEAPIESMRIITVATRIMRFRKNHLIVLIHDIESARFKHLPPYIEYNYFNTFNTIIAHNNIMKAFLAKHIKSDIEIYTLGIFDYLTEKPSAPTNISNNNWEVVFCGNLTRRKASFLFSLSDVNFENWTLNLYGHDPENVPQSSSVKYLGSFSPDRPVVNENSNFGLIWDGDSVDTCTGLFGSYMKMNNPHKLSLYIALSLPIIVWKEAAIARFVEDNKLGFTVDSLSEITDKLSVLTVPDYLQFKQNITLFNQRVISGFYLDSVLTEIEQTL